jgi:predicted NBD/HSP70 family sugar kinase
MGAFVPSDIKFKNRETLFALIKGGSQISRAELARLSGISAPTVLKIIDYFSSLGLVKEAGEGTGSLGRRPQLLRFDPRASFALGAEYDGFNLAVGVVDLAGEIVSLVRRRASSDSLRLVASELEPAVDEALAEAGIGRARVVGLGLGLPGTVDASGRVLRFAPLVGIDRPVDLGLTLDEIEARLGFPILLENDANAAALGEFAARGMGEGGDLIFAVLGRGLGAGIVLDGKLRRGPRGFAGELGYLVFDPAWSASNDEPGWLEKRIDLGSARSDYGDSSGPGREALERAASDLALGFASLAISLDVSVIVIGGSGRERFGPGFMPLLQSALSRLSILELAAEEPLAPEPGVSGAAGLAVDRWMRSLFAG